MTPKERYNANVIWRLRKRNLKIRKQNAANLLECPPSESPLSNSELFYINNQN